MANHYAALDPTWTHLPPAHAAAGHCHYSTTLSSSWLFPGAAAAFENEALTNALRASMSPANNASAASSSSYPTTPSSSSTTSSASELFSSGGGAHDAPAAPAPPSRPSGPPLARGAGAGPKAGRVTKRKPRPSRRPPVTYITADPANFRRMVQEVTGFPVTIASSSGGGLRRHDASEPAPSCWPAPTPASACCALPTLDTSAFLLLDRASVPARARSDDEDKSSSGGDDASPAMAAAAVATAAAVKDGDNSDDTSLLLELEAMACAPVLVSDDFPTLDGWGII